MKLDLQSLQRLGESHALEVLNAHDTPSVFEEEQMKHKTILKTVEKANKPIRLSEVAEAAGSSKHYALKVMQESPRVAKVAHGHYKWKSEEGEEETEQEAGMVDKATNAFKTLVRDVLAEELASKAASRSAGTGAQKVASKNREWSTRVVRGVTIHVPEGYYLTSNRERMFESHIRELEGTFRRPLTDIYINDDWNSDDNKPHNVTYKFGH